MGRGCSISRNAGMERGNSQQHSGIFRNAEMPALWSKNPRPQRRNRARRVAELPWRGKRRRSAVRRRCASAEGAYEEVTHCERRQEPLGAVIGPCEADDPRFCEGLEAFFPAPNEHLTLP